MENYKIYEEIGRGSHSSVYKARQKHTITYVAVKSTAKSRMDKILNEVQLLHKLQSPYVVKFYNWYESQNHIWLILEYCIGGDLSSVIKQDKCLPEKSVRAFGYELMAGLQHLHSNGILFCDLKPANILLDECGSPKFADFGFARSIPTKDSQANKKQPIPASPIFMAPELSQTGIYSFASDFWALGCLLYELYTGQSPASDLTSLNLENLRKAPIAGQPASAEFCHLLSGLIAENPVQRMGWTTLISHPFWEGFSRLKDIEMPEQELYESYYYKMESTRSTRKNERQDNVDHNQESNIPLRSDKANQHMDLTKQSAKLRTSQYPEESQSGITEKPSRKPSIAETHVSSLDATSLRERSPCNVKQSSDITIDPSISRMRPTQPNRASTKVKSELNSHESFGKHSSKISHQHTKGHIHIHCGSSYLKRPSQLILSPQFDANLKPIAYFHLEYVAEVSTQMHIPTTSISEHSELFLHMPTERYLDTQNNKIDVYEPNELLQIPTEKLECHLRDIYQDLKEVHHSTNIKRKKSLLSYLFQLSFHAKLANVLTNSSILIQLIRMLRLEVSSLDRRACAIRTIVTGTEDTVETVSDLCLVLAVLFRFATFISLSSHNEMQSFVKLLIDICLKSTQLISQDRSPHRNACKSGALACLGEFLFLTATQNVEWNLVKEGFEIMWSKLEEYSNDAVFCYYTVQTTCNILSHCQDRHILQQILSEELVCSIIDNLEHNVPSNESSANLTMLEADFPARIVLMKTTVQVLRHVRFTSTLWSSPDFQARKSAIIAIFLRSTSLVTIWKQIEAVFFVFQSTSSEEVAFQCLQLIIATLNCFNLLLELFSISEPPLDNEKERMNIVHDRSDANKADSKKVMLEEIVSFEMLLDMISQIRIRYCYRNTVTESENISSLVHTSSAKFLLFIGLGIQSNAIFALRCIQANCITQLEDYLLPYERLLRNEAAAALIEHFRHQFDASNMVASIMDSNHCSPKSRHLDSQNKLSTSDGYLLQSALHLISILIRSTLKQCSEWILNLSQTSDENVLLDILKRFDQVLENPMCRIQMLCCYLINGGKEGTIFLQLMVKLLEYNSSTTFSCESSKPETKESTFLVVQLLERTINSNEVGYAWKCTNEATVNQLSLSLSDLSKRMRNSGGAFFTNRSLQFDQTMEQLVISCTQILERIFWTPTSQQDVIITPHASWRHVES
ncbi:hypothetical protein ABG067_001802 [Albugo candida]